MQDLWFSLRTVFPLLVMMLVGFIARRLGWISHSGTKQMNNCVYRVFLPLLICFNIMDTDARAVPDARTILFAFVGVTASFLLMFWLVPKFCKQRNACGVLIQGMARSNYAIFGIPLVLMMYPGADTSIAVMLVVVVVPIFNIMSTIALMRYSGETSDWRKMLVGILRNPLTLATALGFLLWGLNFHLPELLDEPLHKLASATTPLSLFLLGAEIDFQKVKTNVRLLTISVIGRLILMPLLFLPIGIMLGIRDVPLAALIAVFASPVAVSSYPMAQQLGGDEGLAGAHVVLTTALSIVTVFFWIFALKSLGYLN